MKKIPLSKGLHALVDNDDYEHLSQWKWYCHSKGYAARGQVVNGKYKIFLMHREITKPTGRLQTDHINGNKLDNRKKNLRTVTNQQNCMNRKLNKNNRLGAKGVYRVKGKDLYRSQIRINGKLVSIGTFRELEKAVRARRKKEKELFGEFMRR